MYKNQSGQKLIVFAFDSNGDGVTGDAANITCKLSIDGAASASLSDTNPTELSSSDQPGVYAFDLTQSETNGDALTFTTVSSTSGTKFDRILIYTDAGVSSSDQTDIGSAVWSNSNGLTILTQVAAILADTGTDIPATLVAIAEYLDTEIAAILEDTNELQTDWADGGRLDLLLDSAASGGGGGSNPALLQETTIATLTGQTEFTLTAGSPDDDAYNDALIVVTDGSTSTQKAVGLISDYVGSTRTVTLSAALAFTIAAGDSVAIIAGASAKKQAEIIAALNTVEVLNSPSVATVDTLNLVPGEAFTANTKRGVISWDVGQNVDGASCNLRVEDESKTDLMDVAGTCSGTTITFSLTNSDTENLTIGCHQFFAQVTYSGSERETLVQGDCNVTEGYTTSV